MIGRTSSQDVTAVSMDLPTLPSLGSGSCLPTSRDFHGIDSSDVWQHQFGPLDSGAADSSGRRLPRVRFHIIGNARIKTVGKYHSCMVSKLPIIYIWKQTVLPGAGSSAEGDRQAVSLIPWTPATVIPSSMVPPHPSSAPPSSPRQVGCASITETKEQDYYAHLVSVAGSGMLGWHFELEDRLGLCPAADGKQLGDEW